MHGVQPLQPSCFGYLDGLRIIVPWCALLWTDPHSMIYTFESSLHTTVYCIRRMYTVLLFAVQLVTSYNNNC